MGMSYRSMLMAGIYDRLLSELADRLIADCEILPGLYQLDKGTPSHRKSKWLW
jgi:hypothetical protein